jgi:hypothetical protein
MQSAITGQGRETNALRDASIRGVENKGLLGVRVTK